MTGEPAITIGALRYGLFAVCDQLEATREKLGQLDAAAGDGDLGVTLAVGFTHVRELLETEAFDDVGTLLTGVGRTLGKNAPSTIGTLLSTAFTRAGAVTSGVRSIGASQIAEILEAAADGVRQRGGVTIGQRTVLDAMVAGAEAARAQADSSATIALSAAASGAQRGADATAAMEPQVGRASWVGARVLGTPDAGAVAWAEILAALLSGIQHYVGTPPVEVGTN